MEMGLFWLLAMHHLGASEMSACQDAGCPSACSFSLGIWSICWPALQLVLSLDGSLGLAICDHTYLLLLLPLLASRPIVLKVCELSCLETEKALKCEMLA